MSQECRLSDLKPQVSTLQWVEVVGYLVESEFDQSMKSQLMAFGILPGVMIACESKLPFSKSRIYQFGSWRGVLRENEAALIRVRLLEESA